ncbi:MAG TPA: hypothetical protein VIU65_10305 [Pyrinomonadaceae bacterium]
MAPDGVHDISGQIINHRCTFTPGPAYFGTPGSPPLVLDGSTPDAQIRVSVTQPTANELVMDATASAISTFEGQNTSAQAAIWADLTFTKAGVLDLSVNPGWSPIYWPSPDSVDSVSIGVREYPRGSRAEVMAVEGLLLRYQPTARIVVTGPSTLRLVMNVSVAPQIYLVNHRTSGSGRAISVKFTPTP